MTFCVNTWFLGKLRASVPGWEGGKSRVRVHSGRTLFSGEGELRSAGASLHRCGSALRLWSPHVLLLPGPWPLPLAGLLQGHLSVGPVH